MLLQQNGIYNYFLYICMILTKGERWKSYTGEDKIGKHWAAVGKLQNQVSNLIEVVFLSRIVLVGKFLFAEL